MEDNYIGKFLDNRYEILELIGTGGMSVVYKARCHRLNRFVAIKILKRDLAQNEDLRRRFHAESQAVAMLSHPNIVAVYDVNHSDNIDYIVMELIEGITLKEYINRKGILNWKEALHFTTQIAKALSHAHSRGIIHRDIKPHNIMILKDGSLKVADFGIARLLTTQNTLTQEALGSVHYISPEQAKGGQVDARSDIYSVGVVMYEMLTSRLPFEGDSAVAIAIQHISSVPLMPRDINPNIPAGLEDITMHAMEPNLDMRYPSADAMLEDLEEFRKNPSITFQYRSTAGADAGKEGAKSSAAKTEIVRKNRGNAPFRDRTTSEEYRRNRKKAGSTSVLIGIFLVIVLLLSLFWFAWTHGVQAWLSPSNERVDVPNFVGKYVEDVVTNAEYTRRYAFTIKEQESDTVSEGYIISQDPTAERSVEVSVTGVNVTLTVSTGPRVVLMPQLINTDYRNARNILENLQYDLVIEMIPEPDDSWTASFVMEQVPAEGTQLKRGMTVYITYCSGPDIQYVALPMLVGRYEEAEAKRALEAMDLSCQIDGYDYSDEVLPGYVSFQSYPAGELLPLHTNVKLIISLGPRPDEGGEIPQPNTGENGEGTVGGIEPNG
ncbi:MAG: Stk1 family PASTA domain-containing Ser/Thr kinase [bacterium]